MNWFTLLSSRFTSFIIPLLFKMPGTEDAGDRFYDETAEFYTSQFSTEKNDDIPLYDALARRAGSPVLEAACGDGRILVPLAEQGFTVVGMDLSFAMLTQCRRRLIESDSQKEKSACLCRASLHRIPFKSVFNLALVPYNSFNHLLTDGEQEACLAGLYRSLKRGGILAMEVLPFHESYFTGLRERKRGVPAGNRTTLTAYSRVSHDTLRHIHTVHWFILIKAPGKPVRRIKTRFSRRDIPLERIILSLKNAGFVIEEVKFGYTPSLDDMNKRIIIARKP